MTPWAHHFSATHIALGKIRRAVTYQRLAEHISTMTPEERNCNAMAFFPIGDDGGYFLTVQAIEPLDLLPGKPRLTKATVPEAQRFMVSVKRGR